MKNIVFIMADQLAASYIGCYKSTVDSTPALDSMAAEGVRFDRYYCSHPSCSPSRATYLTGRSAAIHGIVNNNYFLPSSIPTYAHVLRHNGYRTGGFGKFHVTPMNLPEPDLEYLGFDESVVTEDVKWGPWLEWIKNEHPEYYEVALAKCWDPGQRPIDKETLEKFHTAKREILWPIIQKSDWTSMYTSPLPSDLHDTTFITDKGLDFIERHTDEHAGKPFFCHISYVDPHDPYDPPEPYDKMFDPEDMKDPVPARWIEDGNKVFSDRSYIGFDKICDNVPVIKKLRAMFHGELRFMDDQISRIVEYLKQKNLWDDTIVVFTTDHGDMMGDHQLIAKHTPQFDAGIRCPLIVAGGGIKEGVSEELVSTLDFFPTFCEFAHVDKEKLPPLEGISFADLCYGKVRENSWNEVNVSGIGVETVITKDKWRLSRFLNYDEGQLFDLQNDPDEQNNLYNNPEFSKKRQELLEKLVKLAARPRNHENYRNFAIKKSGTGHVNKSVPVYPQVENPRY